MTVLLYVRRKGWPLKSVTVECSHERVRCRDVDDCSGEDDAYVDVVRQRVALEGEITGEQRERIHRIARRCPVHRLLESPLRIEDHLDVVG